MVFLTLVFVVLSSSSIIYGVDDDQKEISTPADLKGKIVFIEPHYTGGKITECSIVVQDLNSSTKKNIYTFQENKNNPQLEIDKPVVVQDSNPRWLPDGKRIIFIGRIAIASDTTGLYIPADRSIVKPSDIKQLKSGGNQLGQMALLVNHFDIGQGRDLWIINEDGTNLQQLTQFENCINFKLSPDGKKIAFFREQNRQDPKATNGRERVPPFCVMDIDTKRITVLSTPKRPFIDEQYDYTNKDYGAKNKLYYSAICFSDFSWSLDSKKIAFSPYFYGMGGDGNIWIIDIDGSNLHSITKFDPKDDNPASKCRNIYWWPNGKITFSRKSSQWVINSDGTNLEDILETGDYYKLGRRRGTDWFSIDGKKVIFLNFVEERDAKSGKKKLYERFYFKEMGSSKVYFIWDNPSVNSLGLDLFWSE